MNKAWTALIAGALFVTAGCKTHDEAGVQPQESELDIANGALDPGHPQVGQLWRGGKGYCTGTLIAKSTVLTAAHCTMMAQPADITFKLNGKSHQGFKFIKHPSFANDRNDVALLILKNPVTDVTPAPLATAKPTAGQKISIVGYGYDEKGNYDNKKRYATTVVAKVNDMSFTFTGYKNTRVGDSGGPTFTKENGKEVVLGVHCTYENNTGLDMSVPAYKSWININMESGAGGAVQPLTVGALDITPIAADKKTVKGNVNFSIKASSGAGITQVVMMLTCGDNFMRPLQAKATNGTYTASLNTKGVVPNGACQVKTLVYDEAGKSKETNRSITVKN